MVEFVGLMGSFARLQCPLVCCWLGLSSVVYFDGINVFTIYLLVGVLLIHWILHLGVVGIYCIGLCLLLFCYSLLLSIVYGWGTVSLLLFLIYSDSYRLH